MKDFGKKIVLWLIGIAAFAAFVVGWALIDSLINSEVTFADGFSSLGRHVEVALHH